MHDVKFGTARQRIRRRAIAYGRWNPYAPVDEARSIVLGWRDQGLTVEVMSRVSGLGSSTIKGLLYGRTTKVRPATLDRLRATRVSLENYPPTALIDATGTIRRLQALAAIGWPYRAIAARMGVRFQQVHLMLGHRKVTAAKALEVRAIYDELWSHPGPSKRSVMSARAKGWVPPLAWDDDTIDDPSAVPVVGERPRAIDALIEDVTELLAAGETGEGIAWRLGRRLTSMQDQLRSAGRHDLARALRGEVAS